MFRPLVRDRKESGGAAVGPAAGLIYGETSLEPLLLVAGGAHTQTMSIVPRLTPSLSLPPSRCPLSAPSYTLKYIWCSVFSSKEERGKDEKRKERKKKKKEKKKGQCVKVSRVETHGRSLLSPLATTLPSPPPLLLLRRPCLLLCRRRRT